MDEEVYAKENMAKFKWPWETDLVNERVEKTYPLRMPEPYHLMLKVLVEHYGYRSIQKFCWNLVKTQIDKDMAEATGKEKEDLLETLEEMEIVLSADKKSWIVKK